MPTQEDKAREELRNQRAIAEEMERAADERQRERAEKLRQEIENKEDNYRKR